MTDGENKRDDGAPVKRKRGRPPKSAQPRGAETAQPVAAEPEPAKAKVAHYVIAKGKALTSLRGLLGEGEKVAAKDFHGGQDAIKRLLDGGHLEAK